MPPQEALAPRPRAVEEWKWTHAGLAVASTLRVDRGHARPPILHLSVTEPTRPPTHPDIPPRLDPDEQRGRAWTILPRARPQKPIRMAHPTAAQGNDRRLRDGRKPAPGNGERDGMPRVERSGGDVKPERPSRSPRTRRSDPVLLVMPACKDDLVRERLGDSYLRKRNPGFSSSEQAERWRSVLHSEDLHALARSVGLGIAFFAFPHLYPHLEWLAPPAHLEVLHLGITGSLEGLFRRARILVTDDSSVALDMALLKKPIVYFRASGSEAVATAGGCGVGFSSEHTVNGSNTTQGPICDTEDELVNALERLIKSGRHRASVERGSYTMQLRNLGRRARALEALLSLDSSDPDVEAANRRLVEAAELASEAGEWGLAASRWRRVMGLPEKDRPSHAGQRLAAALRELGAPLPIDSEDRFPSSHADSPKR